MSKEKTKTSAEEMLKLHEHTQTLTPEMAECISQDDLWNGLLRFVHEPEKFNAQIENSTVKTGASDRPDTVFERVLDFGSHRVQDTVYLSPDALTIEFHVRETKDYPSSCLRMVVSRSEEKLPCVTFSYFAVREPQVPSNLRPLIRQAWEQKDKDILEQIVLDKLEAL